MANRKRSRNASAARKRRLHNRFSGKVSGTTGTEYLTLASRLYAGTATTNSSPVTGDKDCLQKKMSERL